jgi:tetratricopeptide (TPR) repeat protein
MITSRCFVRLAGYLAALLMAAVCAMGQAATRPQTETARDDRTVKGSVRGRVVLPGGAFVSENIKVTLLTINGPQSTVFTDGQGWFEFPDLTPGNYEVQAETSGSQFQVVSQSVQVFRGAPSIVTISLADKNGPERRADAKTSVSVGELGADVPKDARKEFDLASKATQGHKIDQAIAHLRKAISIYPGFVMARNDLGAQLLAQGKLEEAAEELRQAVSIDEKAFNPKLNLGIVLVQQQQFSEAADVLVRALSLNSESPAARLYAGLAQMGIGNLVGAEKEFKAAYTIGGSSYSLALFHLGQLYMNRGERAQALHAFEGYLHDSPAANNADQVRKMIAMLR